MENDEMIFKKKAALYVKRVIIGIVAFMLVMGCYFIVGAGEVGVVFNKITGNTYSAQQGFHFKLPLLQSVHKFDVKTRKIEIEAEGASKDLQAVKVDTVINYHLEYDKVNNLYVKVGRDYEEKVMKPATWETIKATTAKFPVEQIIVDRETVRATIETALKTRMAIYDIVIETVNLVDIDFSPEFNKIVEEKQIKEQKIKTAEYRKKQAEQEKQSTILVAEGAAKAQELLKNSASPASIQLTWINKWNGALPSTILGSTQGIMIDLKGGK